PISAPSSPFQNPAMILPHAGGAFTVAGNDLPGGNMFDLTNNTAGPININALEVRFGADAFPPIVPPVVPVSVYITVGNTWNGNQTNAAAWTPVALNIPVMKGGINADFSYFDLPAPGITLAPGETRGIYVIGT